MNNNLEYRFSKHDHLAHVVILYFVTEVVQKINNAVSSDGKVAVSWCHLMTSLVGATFPFVRVVDGVWLKDRQHSWVETKYTKNIIDVSPVGCIASPILYPGKPVESQRLDWRLWFTTSKEEVEAIRKIRESDKFKTAFADVFKRTKKIQIKWMRFYHKACKEHHIKPYKKVRLYLFDNKVF